MLKLELFKKLPMDIIINHIMPYTYKPQYKSLLFDIRSFSKDFTFVEDVYYTEYNGSVLICDLIKFCNNNIAPVYGIDMKYEYILKRNYILNVKNHRELVEYIFIKVHRNLNHHTENKIKFIWGLITPPERMRFIHKYIMEYITE
jgi:hypothetical protein